MSPRRLRLDPRFPLVWQDPDTLQIGVDPPVVVLSRVDDRFLPLLHELSTGTSPGGVAVCAQASSIDPVEVDAFLERLGPVLTEPSPPAVRSLVLDAPRPLATGVRAVFETLDYRVVEAESEAPGSEVLIVADFVLDPLSHHSWLRRDVIHTPIVFSDQSVRVGPRVAPGVSPCAYCLFLHRVEAHPATVAVHSQLWGTRAAAHTPSLEARAAWVALEMIESDTLATICRIDHASLTISTETSTHHPECGCRGLAASPVREEID